MTVRFKTIFALSIMFLMFSCSKNSTKETENEKVITIDPNELTLGPIQNEELSESQLEKIKTIHKTFEEVYKISLEETINNFKRDANIDNEINLWMKMREAYGKVIEEKEFNTFEQRKGVFALILMRTMMSKKDVIESAEVKGLSEEDVDYILTEFDSTMEK